MAKQELKSNVYVDGKWYGPDYPANEVTGAVLDQVTNPAAFEDPVVGNASYSPPDGEVPGAADTEAETPRRGRRSAAETPRRGRRSAAETPRRGRRSAADTGSE